MTSCVTLLRFTFSEKNLELNLDKENTFNPFLVIVLCDFNAKPCNWCVNDRTNFEGAQTDTLIS